MPPPTFPKKSSQSAVLGRHLAKSYPFRLDVSQYYVIRTIIILDSRSSESRGDVLSFRGLLKIWCGGTGGAGAKQDVHGQIQPGDCE